jgi:homoserine kinase
MLARVRVPATTANLGPGFDAFGAAVALHLEVEAPARGGPRVEVKGEGAGELPADESNLAWRALVAACDHMSADVPDVSLRMRNPIPLERGLGSSAAAIVGGLHLGRVLVDGPLSDRDMIVLAAELEGHPDNVAPAVLGGLVCTARGDDGGLVVRRRAPPPRGPPRGGWGPGGGGGGGPRPRPPPRSRYSSSMPSVRSASASSSTRSAARR